jgi:2-C-methyl-D-erythritol 4-phosphate cytidylyltransferase
MIVVAAGSGSRMGTEIKKQYLPLAGKPILIRTLQTLEQSDRIDRIIVVVAADDIGYVQDMIHEHGLQKVDAVVGGGEERQNSVANGLRALNRTTQYVAVHDAARPLVTLEEIENVIDMAMTIGGATLGVPVKDTIKRVEKHKVMETLPRESLWAVHTPQAFRRDWLQEAHHRSARIGVPGTDDASLVEWAGYTVQMVQGSYQNLKITTPEDLVIAEALWQQRKGSEQR